MYIKEKNPFLCYLTVDGIVKSLKMYFFVIPEEAGIQLYQLVATTIVTSQ